MWIRTSNSLFAEIQLFIGECIYSLKGAAKEQSSSCHGQQWEDAQEKKVAADGPCFSKPVIWTRALIREDPAAEELRQFFFLLESYDLGQLFIYSLFTCINWSMLHNLKSNVGTALNKALEALEDADMDALQALLGFSKASWRAKNILLSKKLLLFFERFVTSFYIRCK